MSLTARLLRRRHTPQGQKGLYLFAQGLRKASRTAIINHLVLRRGYRDYLEIGVRTNDNFARVTAPNKAGVDPAPEGACTHVMTSDAFFASLPAQAAFDLVFIDGLHTEFQVLRDVEHALEHLRPGGSLVLHDCNPPTAWHAREECVDPALAWNGTVWRAWAHLRCTRRDLSMRVVDSDWGVGIIERGAQDVHRLGAATLDFAYLDSHRRELLNLISVERFLQLY